MIQLFKKYIFDYYLSYKYNKIIKKNDNYKNFINLEGKKDNLENLKKNGFLIIDNFLGKPIKYNEFNWKNFGNSVKKIHTNVIEENSLSHKIISDNKLNEIIIGYLGPKAVLDYVEIQRTEVNSKNKSISEKWHYDNVGSRIKIFYFLNDCEQIFTDYLQGTNSIYHKKYSTNSSRVSEKIIQKLQNQNNSIFPKKDRLLIIDTNGFHRGIYRSQDEKSTDYREMILFEYSNIEKSNELNSEIIGPRNTFFSKKINFSNILVEKNYLTDCNEFYFYDKNYVKSF